MKTKMADMMITCPNSECQAPNPTTHNFCAHCRTSLPKRYLWGLGDELNYYKPGQVISNRYLLANNTQKRILLDLKPGLEPELTDKIPPELTSYLRLFAYRPQVPQLFGIVTSHRTGRKSATIYLLEGLPIYGGGLGAAFSGKLMPEISEAWKTTSSIRQLNWLWQIAQMWDGFTEEGVSATLLLPERIRVDGGIVRILELVHNQNRTPTLKDLGKLWQNWQKYARLSVAKSIDRLCNDLVSGEIQQAEELIKRLDEVLKIAGQKQFLQCNYLTLSHPGPTRESNEDACYPQSGSPLQQNTQYELSLAIVCDGVGGHQGGEVASALAIKTIRERIEKVLSKAENHNPATISAEIAASTCVANDLISLRNDTENRQDRQRMGTTMVMTLVYGHEVYIAHVGDSRVYRITRTGCHQMTLDDDLASREVRLGYTLYRDALNNPSSGSLYQALGMNSSSNLHPTVRRLVVDEECIFLICSDGVSDNDRIEQNWQTEILPVLEGKIDLTAAIHRLLNMANTLNGHDNSTIALLHCQVKQPVETGQTNTILQSLPESSITPDTLLLSSPEDKLPLSSKSVKPPAKKPLLLIGGLVTLAMVVVSSIVFFTLGNGQSPTGTTSPRVSPSTSPEQNSETNPSTNPSPTSIPSP